MYKQCHKSTNRKCTTRQIVNLLTVDNYKGYTTDTCTRNANNAICSSVSVRPVNVVQSVQTTVLVKRGII